MSPCRNVFAPSPAVDFFGKSRLACFYTCGSSVTLRLGFLTESKSGDNKIATDFPAVPICARGGIGRHDGFRCCHLGERFLRHPRRGHSSVKAGMPVFIAADQALRSASVPRRVKTEGNKIATGGPAAYICARGGIGRHDGFRFHCASVQVQVLSGAPLRNDLWMSGSRAGRARLDSKGLSSFKIVAADAGPRFCF